MNHKNLKNKINIPFNDELKYKILDLKNENIDNFYDSSMNILKGQYNVRQQLLKTFQDDYDIKYDNNGSIISSRNTYQLIYALGLTYYLDNEDIKKCNSWDDINNILYPNMFDISTISHKQLCVSNNLSIKDKNKYLKCLCGQWIRNVHFVKLNNNQIIVIGSTCIDKKSILLTNQFKTKLKKEKRKLKQMKEEEKKIIEKQKKILSLLSQRYKNSDLELRIEGYNILCNKNYNII
tara:strand:+ start:1225 stop:1932 length:708 start_codon:yes stop_codon:yes gene_type:complete